MGESNSSIFCLKNIPCRTKAFKNVANSHLNRTHSLMTWNPASYFSSALMIKGNVARISPAISTPVSILRRFWGTRNGSSVVVEISFL